MHGRNVAKKGLMAKLKKAEARGAGTIMQHGSERFDPKKKKDIHALESAPAGSLFLLYGQRRVERKIGPGLKVIDADERPTVFFCVKQEMKGGLGFMPLFLHGPKQGAGWERYNAGIYALGKLLEKLELQDGSARFYRAKVQEGGHWFGRLRELAE
ncbi:MAG: hypothetical protein ABH854_02575 [Candidatus Diapherotrites archaeon]|nr:hypothetical protein [Candidatus Micrarchaeota archaeon]MBU1939248.1 hypothetical protein [Candidatus Micrarchaeota archaeon]